MLFDQKTHDASYGAAIGHAVIKNIWVSVGYNFVGFYDRDFSQGRSTSQGVYMKFRIKFIPFFFIFRKVSHHFNNFFS